ncbi:MAG TPA: ABC transporter substrate-binding protein, partial [Actinomycetota bacterium]|nr:ABC transporter substrate-binding protein [Actinomycetota bacterium]
MRRSKWMVFVAMLSAFALIGAACGGDDPADPGADPGDDEPEVKQCTWVIGTMGALSGDYASVGQPIADGVEYAVTQANDAGDVPCTLEVQTEDSQGDPNQAPALAEKLISNENLVFCACPYFSGET